MKKAKILLYSVLLVSLLSIVVNAQLNDYGYKLGVQASYVSPDTYFDPSGLSSENKVLPSANNSCLYLLLSHQSIVGLDGLRSILRIERLERLFFILNTLPSRIPSITSMLNLSQISLNSFLLIGSSTDVE